MARVKQQRAGKQHAGGGSTRAAQTAKQRRSQKVVLESNARDQNQLRSVLSFKAEPPPGYTFIPAGNPQLTNALKEAAREGDHKILSVSTTPHAARHELSRVVHRVGYHFPTPVVAQVCAQYGIRLDSRGHVINENGNDDKAFMKIYQNGELVLKEKVQGQIDINTEAKETITDLFPNIPDKDLFQIIKTAFQLGTGKVGTADEIPLVRRAQLSVVAHIRHVYTNYDKLIKQIPYNDARHAVEQETLSKLVAWVGDDDNASDEAKKRAVQDMFREVIVLSDDEASDSEGDDTEQLAQNELRVEELPISAYAPASGRPLSPRRGYTPEEASSGIRVLTKPTYRYHTSEADRAARDRDRYARWEQARQQYRSAAMQPAPVFATVYVPESLPERRLVPLGPTAGQVIQRQYLGHAEGRQVDIFEVRQPARPYSPQRYEQQFTERPQYERIISRPSDPVPPVRTVHRRTPPSAHIHPGSRPLTPPNRGYRNHRRTPSLGGGDGTILPSIEDPRGAHGSAHPNFADGRPRGERNIIDLTSSIEQPSKRQRMEGAEISHIERFNPFASRNDPVPYDPRERSPRRSPPRNDRQIIDIVNTLSEAGFRPERQYREVREVEYPAPRRMMIAEDESRNRYAGGYVQQSSYQDSHPPQQVRMLEPISPSPREPVIRRIIYPEDSRPGIEPLEPARRYDNYTSSNHRGYMPTPESLNSARNRDSYNQNQQIPVERRIVYAMPSTNVPADRGYERLPETTYVQH